MESLRCLCGAEVGGADEEGLFAALWAHFHTYRDGQRQVMARKILHPGDA